MFDDESQFHAIADTTLSHFYDQLEAAFVAGAIEELELNSGMLTIETADGKSLIVSKHAPTFQLWLASPVSGGLHFSYHATQALWMLADGRRLNTLLSQELWQLAQVKVTL